MKATLTKWFTRFNVFLIRISRGKIGSQLGTQSILILHTTGRRSGAARTTPVAYFEYQGKYLLVASNWARQTDADWLLNLRKQPRAAVEVKGRSLPVIAREAQGEQYEHLWQFVTLRHSPYLKYQELAQRPIPIVILEPAG